MFIKRCDAKNSITILKDRKDVGKFEKLASKLVDIDTDKYLYIINESVHCLEHYGPNANGDAFPLDEMRKKYHTFISSRVSVDHQDHLDVGEIFDSVFVEPLLSGKSVTEAGKQNFMGGGYIQNILGVNKDKVTGLQKSGALRMDLLNLLLDGKITDTSMGAIVAYTECLPPWIKIFTLDGWKKIKDIKNGEQVLTHLGRFKTVTNTMVKKPDTLIRITYRTKKNGKKNLIITPKHPILTQKGWIDAGKITINDKMVALTKKCLVCGSPIVYSEKSDYCSKKCACKINGGKTVNSPKFQEYEAYEFSEMDIVNIERFTPTKKYNNVYNISVEDDESYVAEGIVVHNCSIPTCKHIAYTEGDYCEHIKGGKNREIKLANDDNSYKVFEVCHGVTWFEDSIIVPLSLGGLAGGEGADEQAKVMNIVTESVVWENKLIKLYDAIKRHGSIEDMETFEELLNIIGG